MEINKMLWKTTFSLGLVVLLLSCENKPTENTLTNQMEASLNEVGDSIQSYYNSTLEDLKDEKDRIGGNIDQLNEKIKTLSGDAKVKASQKLAQLNQKKDSLSVEIKNHASSTKSGIKETSRKVREDASEIGKDAKENIKKGANKIGVVAQNGVEKVKKTTHNEPLPNAENMK